MTKNHKVYRHVVIWFLVLLFAIGISLFVGSTGITWKFDNQLEWTIFYKLRVPRTLLALIAGLGLVMSGQIYQTILNNPLADSFTLGLASGATFGSGLAVILGLGFLFIPLLSMIFSLITLILVILITSFMSRGYPTRSLILAGIMIGALFNALLYVLIIFNERKMNNIVNYMFGGFSSAEYNEIYYIGLVLILCIIILYSLMPRIKLLQLGEMHAQSLGIKSRNLTYTVLFISSILTATIVSFVGVIGFIGMVIPQLIRRYYVGYSLGIQMTLNIIIGGTVIVIADWFGGIILQTYQIPASIVLALIGIPVLFYLMVTQPKTVD